MAKPHVICHMVAPLDGRLMTDSWAPSGTPMQQTMQREYQRLHDEFAADAWLAGTTTMEDFASGDPSPVDLAAPQPARPWHLADASATRFAIAIDRHGRLHWQRNTADNGHVVVVLGASVPDTHLAELAATRVSYLVMPSDDIDVAAMLSDIGSRLPIRTLLLEGGAKINGAFLKAGVVDEISLLLCPAVDGRSGSPCIFEAGDSSIGTSLALALHAVDKCEAGIVHLRYQVKVA